MLFSAEKLGDNTNHINIAIITVGLETVAAKYFEPITFRQLLAIDFRYPSIHNLL